MKYFNSTSFVNDRISLPLIDHQNLTSDAPGAELLTPGPYEIVPILPPQVQGCVDRNGVQELTSNVPSVQVLSASRCVPVLLTSPCVPVLSTSPCEIGPNH